VFSLVSSRQPSQVVAGIAPVAGRRPVAGNQQPDLVVVVQSAHRHAGERGDLPNRVRLLAALRLPCLHVVHAIDARAARRVRVKPGGDETWSLAGMSSRPPVS
jgi:hypothetical protein